MTEKICLMKNCDGVLKIIEDNEFIGHEWVCEKCGSVFKSNLDSNKKLRAYKITDKIDFIKWIFSHRLIQAVFIIFILIKLIFQPFYDIFGFIIVMCVLIIIILIYGFIDLHIKNDYLKSKGIDIYA